MRCFFSQVHQCCRLPGFDHEAGHSGRKCLYRLPHLWLGGVSCCLPHPVHHWAHRPTPPLRRGQFCSWSLLFHHCLYSWQWVIFLSALERWFPSFLLMVLFLQACFGLRRQWHASADWGSRWPLRWWCLLTLSSTRRLSGIIQKMYCVWDEQV